MAGALSLVVIIPGGTDVFPSLLDPRKLKPTFVFKYYSCNVSHGIKFALSIYSLHTTVYTAVPSPPYRWVCLLCFQLPGVNCDPKMLMGKFHK